MDRGQRSGTRRVGCGRRFEDVLKGAQEVFARKGLLKKRAELNRMGRAMEFFDVSGHEDDFEFGKFFLSATSQLRAAHAGHDDISDQKTDGILQAVGYFERFGAVACSEDLITGGLQEFAGECANGVFIFHQKNCFARFGRGGHGLGEQCG